ncbi:1954_t:CDS:2 [Diversispora eburnea]|uniref:1954_t:CDS:1 n=1 Tax=Diversispora eburnea TaxID=1213867 RepID=A0A9N9FUT3_9GLOM|nr:1954_t:CDS:2 [Diversispora eburnea]
MPPQILKTEYPPIDTDPHFNRVVRYFRPSDYASWAAMTEKTANQPPTPRIGFALKLCAFVGFTGGFLFAYQRSSYRFWGWTENSREYEKDLREMRQRVKEGKPLYGESSLDDHLQQYASRFSRYAALNFVAYPVFNFVNHNYHGVDTSRYYEGIEEEKEFEAEEKITDQTY